MLQHGEEFPVLVWTAAVHFLFTRYGNLPAECHGLVFLCGLKNCRHLVSASSFAYDFVQLLAAAGLSAGATCC